MNDRFKEYKRGKEQIIHELNKDKMLQISIWPEKGLVTLKFGQYKVDYSGDNGSRWHSFVDYNKTFTIQHNTLSKVIARAKQISRDNEHFMSQLDKPVPRKSEFTAENSSIADFQNPE